MVNTEIKKRVLLVSKRHSEREAVKYLLESLACSVDVASNGLKALKLIDRHPQYQLLITPLVVDHISGLALHLIAKNKNPGLKTVAVNNGGWMFRSIAKEFDIHVLLEQPLDPLDVDHLCDAAREALDGILLKDRLAGFLGNL
jgi:DNA-binding NtrC family response regulator